MTNEQVEKTLLAVADLARATAKHVEAMLEAKAMTQVNLDEDLADSPTQAVNELRTKIDAVTSHLSGIRKAEYYL